MVFSFLYHPSYTLDYFILFFFLNLVELFLEISWESFGSACKEVLSLQLQNQVEVAVFWTCYSLYFGLSGIAFAVEVNLLAQCWFCTVCVKWGMAESRHSEACQAFLEDLVYWRHKWGCSAELLVFYEAVIHNQTYFKINTFNEESEMCSWCWKHFPEFFVPIYTHTEVPRHIWNVHHCETFRWRRSCFYWIYEAEIIPVFSSLTGAIISVVFQ